MVRLDAAFLEWLGHLAGVGGPMQLQVVVSLEVP